MPEIRTMILSAVIVAAGGGAFGGAAQAASFTGTYTQDFNTLASGPANTVVTWTDNATIPGIYAFNSANPNVYVTDNGFAYINTIQSLGGAGAADRALVSTNNGAITPGSIGLRLTNDTGGAVAAISVAYVAEQWYRQGTGANSELDFAYSLDATGLNSGTYTAVGALDATAPNGQSGSSTRIGTDGNDAANRVSLSAIILLSTLWIPGADLWLRWQSPSRSSHADGFAVDDVSVGIAPVPLPAALPLYGAGVALMGFIGWRRKRAARSA